MNTPENLKNAITKSDILADTSLLTRVAGYITDGKSLLDMILSAREDEIRKYIIEQAHPDEMIAWRVALQQIESLRKDCDSYVSEMERRKADKRRKKEGND